MTTGMPDQGHDDHHHDHPHGPGQAPPMPLDTSRVVLPGQMGPGSPEPGSIEAKLLSITPQPEAISEGAQQWLAREFVGGLLAMAQALGSDPADFLAEKAQILAQMLATQQSEVNILKAQCQALVAENHALQRKIDDCGCSEAGDETTAEAQALAAQGLGRTEQVFPPDVVLPPGSHLGTTNGAERPQP